MDVRYPGFGTIVVNDQRYDHDVVIDAGVVRARDKRPSRAAKRGGHTPLTIAEDIPWSGARLIIGTGASGRLPIRPEIAEQALADGVELVAIPTAQASKLLESVPDHEVYAVLHVTC